MTGHTARQLEAIAAAFAEDVDAVSGRRTLEIQALQRGAQELYEEHVRGSEFDLRRKRAIARRKGLRVV